MNKILMNDPSWFIHHGSSVGALNESIKAN